MPADLPTMMATERGFSAGPDESIAPDVVSGTPDLGYKLVTALFDTRLHADKARIDLIQAGVPETDVTTTGTEDLAADSTVLAPEERGFWDALKHLFMPEEDHDLYAEGLRRGGYHVAVRTDSAACHAVIDILDRDGAVDMDEREADWRSQGWTPTSAARDWAGGPSGATNEMAYAAADQATAGFAVSEADQLLSGEETPPVAATTGSGLAPRRDMDLGRARVRAFSRNGGA